ncbi:CBS domain-containing protein [Bacilli bacterium]|uniref:CBS domain-containing protein n=1 Tax=Oceanobacillus TaxID=182709 RepID=UPI0006227924|nr:CBS domain-containing protein [Oceanobacillus caeni]KKE78987.1 CBS domain-containing protein YhcV [Bacilli bacterium VT-13-104]PZD83620.1 CBS domain-containing protein [Bacilli bacterium]MBU8791617.1 CBS domain-containing protein [Oceanobacillus caeni]PZD85646.1 CBS domain-containing protein [Bacilli bacterium]PZD88850.1 CBS domain-containing protein [Bacilli bacterium]
MTQLRNMMTQNVMTVNESQSVQEAAAIMSQYNIGAVPVVNSGGQMVGIVTDRDITLRTTAQGQNAQTPVSEVMTAQQMVKGTPDMDADQAAELMSQQQIRRLPIEENGQLVGMVALGDLAVQNQHADEAGQALASISTPSSPQQ